MCICVHAFDWWLFILQLTQQTLINWKPCKMLVCIRSQYTPTRLLDLADSDCSELYFHWCCSDAHTHMLCGIADWLTDERYRLSTFASYWERLQQKHAACTTTYANSCCTCRQRQPWTDEQRRTELQVKVQPSDNIKIVFKIIFK